MASLVRKEIRALSTRERSALFNAITTLKESGIYDRFVHWHSSAMMMSTGSDSLISWRNRAHYSPVFLPWHREFLIRFENALRDLDQSISLPYWDWTIDATLSDPSMSDLWKDDFLGGSSKSLNGRVIDGPFSNWIIQIPSPKGATNEYLRREFNLREQLPFRQLVENVITIPKEYDKFPWDQEQTAPYSFRFLLEMPLHNPVHNWVGGTMAETYSPADPVFFFHHSNIDRIWANWQKKHSFLDSYPASGQIIDRNSKTIEYTNRNDPIYPWIENDHEESKIVKDLLNFTLYYEYDKYYVE